MRRGVTIENNPVVRFSDDLTISQHDCTKGPSSIPDALSGNLNRSPEQTSVVFRYYLDFAYHESGPWQCGTGKPVGVGCVLS